MRAWLLLLALWGCKHDYNYCCNCFCKVAGTCESFASVSGDHPIDCKPACDERCQLAGCPTTASMNEICGGSDAAAHD